MSSLTEALAEAGVDINLVQIPLGQERGFVRIWESGNVEFHLVHKPDDEVYPGEEDFVEFEPTADDVNLFRVIADHLQNMYDEQEEEKRQEQKKKRPEPEKSPELVKRSDGSPVQQFKLRP